MTESQWLTCTDPQVMLDFLHGKASDRKLRLFACGCARQVWGLLKDERSRTAVETAERFADGLVTRSELSPARSAARRESWLSSMWPVDWAAAAMWSTMESARRAAEEAARRAAKAWSMMVSARKAARKDQATILRDIFGNPFRCVPLAHVWLTWNNGSVPSLAQGIYDDQWIYWKQAFERMPILADALEEAGCDNADILGHCRQPGTHVRGCWALDLLLGKE